MADLDFGPVEDFSEGERRAQGPVLVLRDQGRLIAVGSRCPHMGYPMAKGTLRDGILTCAWHGWDFDLDHGGCYRGACDDLPVYPLTVVAGRILVTVGDAVPDLGREADRLREALLDGDVWLEAKALSRWLDAGGDLDALAGLVLAHGFDHAIAAHRSRQAAVEAGAVLDAITLARRVSPAKQLAALLQGVRTVGGPVGSRARIIPVPATVHLRERAARYVDEPSPLGLERLFLATPAAVLPALAVDLATRPCLLDHPEVLAAVVVACSSTATAPERRAALLGWILGAERGEDDGETRLAKVWYEEWLAGATVPASGEPTPDAIVAALATATTGPAFLAQVAAWLAGAGVEATLTAFAVFFARRAAHQVPGSGGLVPSGLTGLRWARAARLALPLADPAQVPRLVILLAWHAFRSRWLQGGADEPRTQAGDLAVALAANQAGPARAAALALAEGDGLVTVLDLVVDDDLGAGLLEVVAEGIALREADHPAWRGALGAALNGLIDQRLRSDVKAAARFGRGMT